MKNITQRQYRDNLQTLNDRSNAEKKITTTLSKRFSELFQL